MGQETIRIPRPEDYDESATQKAVLSESLQHPLTTVPVGIGAIAGLGLLMLTTCPPLIGGIVLGGGLCLGLASLGVNFIGRRDQLATKYHRALHQLSKQAGKAQLSQLQSLLGQIHCEKGSAQAEDVVEKFDTLRAVLERRLEAGELTFSRYLAIAENIYRSILGSLERITALLISIRDIDVNDLDVRIASIQRKTRRNENSERELTTLKERRDVFDKVNQEVDQLLVVNEEALTALDKASVAAARIEIGHGAGSESDLTAAMEDLSRLLARTAASAAPNQFSFEPPQLLERSTKT